MKKVIFFLFPVVLTAQHVFSPLGMGVLELGWKYTGWNPAALRLLSSDGFVFDFVYQTNGQDEEITNVWTGYQQALKDLSGELLIGMFKYGGLEEYSLKYSLAGSNPEYLWGAGFEVFSRDGGGGLRFSVGVIGEKGKIKYAISLKDFTVYSTNLSDLARGQAGIAIGYITPTAAFYAGAISTDFKYNELYAGISLGVKILYMSSTFGVLPDTLSYHFGMGFAILDTGGFFIAGNFDYVPNPPGADVDDPRRFSTLPYRFTVTFKIPSVEEGSE